MWNGAFYISPLFYFVFPSFFGGIMKTRKKGCRLLGAAWFFTMPFLGACNAILYYSTFTYYGYWKADQNRLLGSNRQQAKCEFDSFCFTYLHRKLFARSWRHLGAVIFVPLGWACIKPAWERSFVCHPRAWQKACQHFDKLCGNA